MHTETPRIFQDHMLKAISACKRVQVAMIDIGEIAIPEDAMQQRSWQLLNVSLQNVMRLLITIRQATGYDSNRRSRDTGRTGDTSEGLFDSDPFSCPELDEVLADLVDRAAIEEVG
jgi:hypothetical protein